MINKLLANFTRVRQQDRTAGRTSGFIHLSIQRSRLGGLLALLLFFALTTALPASSQDRGLGVIREGNLAGAESIGTLNPLRCGSAACRRITNFLFPTLLAVNPATGLFTAGTADNNGLADSWLIVGEGWYSFSLREDAVWSDGTPITAYDVLYSYLAIASDDFDSPYTDTVNDVIEGVVPLDDHNLYIFTEVTTCGAYNIMNLPVIPAHVFDPAFADDVRAVVAEVPEPDDVEAERAALEEAAETLRQIRSFSFMARHSFDYQPEVTGGVFAFREIRPRDSILLQTADGSLGYAYVDMPDADTRVNRFLEGELNLIVNPPLNRREEIRSRPGIQVYSYPGNSWDTISFNLADPRNPMSIYDEDGNQTEEQGVHPIFGDVRVRRAVQMAIDVPFLIDSVFKGEATPITSYQLPTSWAYNPDLQPISYNPIAAGRLLDQAGWRRSSEFGERFCNGCLYAQPESRLAITLLYDSRISQLSTVASVIAEQLTRVGFSVRVDAVDGGNLENPVYQQRYDAYLHTYFESYPADPDVTYLFTRWGDFVGAPLNISSYDNPQVTALLERANNVPSCDPAERAELYREVQAILYEDQPNVWLYAPNQFVAVGPNVQGFAPYPNAPFWNIADWVVFGD